MKGEIVPTKKTTTPAATTSKASTYVPIRTAAMGKLTPKTLDLLLTMFDEIGARNLWILLPLGWTQASARTLIVDAIGSKQTTIDAAQAHGTVAETYKVIVKEVESLERRILRAINAN